jgi:hypothetical protein
VVVFFDFASFADRRARFRRPSSCSPHGDPTPTSTA